MNRLSKIIFIGALTYAHAYSEDTTIIELMQRIEQLENRIVLLEKIVSEYSSASSEKYGEIPSDKKLWRKLRKGMSPDDVRKLLGEPLTISTGGITQWYYSKSVSHSYVYIMDRGGVMGWNEPE